MNERIRELCSQAISDVDGIQNPDTQNMYIPDCFAEKFAELIVQECAKIAYNKQYKHSSAHTRGDCAEAIKEHFGVEE